MRSREYHTHCQLAETHDMDVAFNLTKVTAQRTFPGHLLVHIRKHKFQRVSLLKDSSPDPCILETWVREALRRARRGPSRERAFLDKDVYESKPCLIKLIW